MRISGQLREKAGIVAVVALALLALYNTLRYQDAGEILSRAQRSGRWMGYSLIRFEVQWDCLREDLEPHALVGFVTPLPPEIATEYYLLAQYTLAPVLVENSAQHALVLGYAPDPGDLDTLLSAHPNLRVRKNCQNGVILFEGGN
jgi:hypothetical protein